MVRASLLEDSLHRRFLVVIVAATFAIGLSASGCSGEAEGERCDVNDDNSGNDDCASGLICYASTNLGGVAEANHTDICCPSDRTQATTSICAQSPTPPGGNPAPPDAGPDTGVKSDGATDAPTDSPTDAPLDSPLDSPTDSPADAPLDAPPG